MVIKVEVFKTEMCPHCPKAVALVKEVTKDLENVEVEIIDAMQNPKRALEYGIMAVPAIVINGTKKFIGMPSRGEFVQALTSMK
ncbi:MAG: MJ0307 family thioredoxin [Candidatus Hydrothermarchaeota archaeon]|nr:MJ0307 family thioredoxin [Candidatus Hydrothermarchaeota archaeon]